MKKTLLFILTAIIVCCFISCKDKNDPLSAETTDETPDTRVRVKNIAEFLSLQEEEEIIYFDNAVTVTYQNGLYLFVKDNSGSLLLYGDIKQIYNNGDQIESICGKYHSYFGLPEMAVDSATFGGRSVGNNPVSPEVVSTISENDLSRYVKLENVQFSKNVSFNTSKKSSGTLTNGIYVYNSFLIAADCSALRKYDITGIVSLYNDALELNPILIEEKPTFAINSINGNILSEFTQVPSFVGSFVVGLNNYDDNDDFEVKFDASWIRVKNIENRGTYSWDPERGDQIYIFLECDNNYGQKRGTQMTISKSTGEILTFYIPQQACYTMKLLPLTEFTYNGQNYNGFNLTTSDAYSMWVFVENYNDSEIYVSMSDSWITLDNKVKLDVEAGDGHSWRYEFSTSKNYGYNRLANIYFSKSTGEFESVTVFHAGPYGEKSSGGGSGGGTGGGGSSDPTAGYTITQVSVCAIYMLDNSNTGDKYSRSYYKWVSSTGKVVLSRSATNSAYWIGVASKNYDSKCGGYTVSGYSYKYVDYTPVGGAWYYYFN